MIDRYLLRYFLAVIDQGGHACNITDPAGFDALAGSFLSEG